MGKRSGLAVLALLLVLLPATLSPALASATPGAVPDEHVRPVSGTGHAVGSPMKAEPAITSTRRSQFASAASMAASNAFLTRPYTTWHNITSIFDHCNPDYSLDGKVCEFDGSLGLKSNGVDPGFSSGYAQTPGATDYLYYDGHNGWDYALAYENVLAAADGTVRLAGSDPNNPCFGQTIIVDHPSGFSTRYAHLSQIYVSVGSAVTRGQVIAVSGNTGCSSGPHLHFGVYITSSWTAIDPWGWWGAPGADPWSSDQGDLWLTGYAQFPLPHAPQNVSATPGDGYAMVTWTAPDFDGGSGISQYQVVATPGGNTATVTGSTLTAKVGGLTDGTSYTFTVTALNTVGLGPVSAASNAVIPTGGPIVTLSATSLDLGSQNLGTVSASKTLTITNTGLQALNNISVTATGDFAAQASCPASLAINTSCTVAVTFKPTTIAPRTGALQISDSAADSPQHVALLGNGSGTWSAAESMGFKATSAPSVTSWGANRLDVFARGSDLALWHTWWDGRTWHAWQSLGGTLLSAPAAVSWGPNRIDVFVRAAGDALWHIWWDGAQWGPWQSLGGVINSAPAASSWGPGRIDVFARSGDNGLWHIWWDGAWESWQALGGTVTADPAAVSWGGGRIDIVVRSADSQLWHMWFDAGQWNGWQPLGGQLLTGPGVASWTANRLDILAADSSGVNHLAWNGTWQAWESLGGSTAFNPAAVSWGDSRIDLFVTGPDGTVSHRWFD